MQISDSELRQLPCPDTHKFNRRFARKLHRLLAGAGAPFPDLPPNACWREYAQVLRRDPELAAGVRRYLSAAREGDPGQAALHLHLYSDSEVVPRRWMERLVLRRPTFRTLMDYIEHEANGPLAAPARDIWSAVRRATGCGTCARYQLALKLVSALRTRSEYSRRSTPARADLVEARLLRVAEVVAVDELLESGPEREVRAMTAAAAFLTRPYCAGARSRLAAASAAAHLLKLGGIG